MNIADPFILHNFEGEFIIPICSMVSANGRAGRQDYSNYL